MSFFKTYRRALICVLTFALAGCAGTSSPKPPAPEEYGPAYEGVPIAEKTVEQQNAEEQYGPLPSPEGAPPAPVEAAVPAPPAETAPAPQPAKLCLVLGPGMAKALAEAAVIEAIRKAQIPVHCVVGTEMGAVVGGLYAYGNGNTNSLQWQLFKFNKDNYLNFPVISLRTPKSSGKRLHDFLQDVFRGKKIEDLPVPFATVAVDSDRDSLVQFDRGSLTDALSATLAMPGLFEPWRLNGVAYVSGAIESPAPVDLARKLGGNFLVLIDVLEDSAGGKGAARFHKAFSPARNLMRLQKKEASFVISVKAGAIGFDAFDHQG
jgi:predicted acylesterase/phospholipase RssA